MVLEEGSGKIRVKNTNLGREKTKMRAEYKRTADKIINIPSACRTQMAYSLIPHQKFHANFLLYKLYLLLKK
jgi:hypothetical protein